VGELSPDGRSVSEDIVGVGCTEATIDVRSFLIQGGVVGLGNDTSDCTGQPEIVTLAISTESGRFEPGPARLCAVVVERNEAGRPVDAIARCSVITLA
jgi:hypothetical protein